MKYDRLDYDYHSKNINYSDLEAVKSRLVRIEATREEHARREVQAKRARHARRVKRAVPTPEHVRSSPSSLASIINSYSFQTGFACVLMAGMVGFFGLLASGVMEGRTETAFDAQCRANDPNYVSRSRTYCAESKRFAHQLTEERLSELPQMIVGSIRRAF